MSAIIFLWWLLQRLKLRVLISGEKVEITITFSLNN